MDYASLMTNIDRLIEENRTEMIDGLCQVLRFASELGEPVTKADGSVYPFGEEIQKCMEKVLEMAQEMGFETVNVDNYGAHIDWKGSAENPKIFGILGHLDVVPAGTGWDMDPYAGIVENDVIYGRGTTDDKGPVMEALYAMKLLKDSGYVPVNTIRIILGLDEETAWKGMDYYFDHVERPDYGFTPDADFPVINGEKGMMSTDMARKFGKSQNKGLVIRSLKGGTVHNAVSASCRAVLRMQEDEKTKKKNEKTGAGTYDKVKEIIEAFKIQTGCKVNYKGVGKSLEIVTTGKAAHAAKPFLGVNANAIMMDLLGRMNFANEDQNDFISFYNSHIAYETDGSSMGLKMSDDPEEMGVTPEQIEEGREAYNLTLNQGTIEMDEEIVKFNIDMRFPVTKKFADVAAKLSEAVEKYDIGIYNQGGKEPIYKDLNSPMVKDLVEAYENSIEGKGIPHAEPMIVGGGTYAKATPGIVAYGSLFPGDPDLMHQKNECLAVDRYLLAIKVFADAISRLASKDY